MVANPYLTLSKVDSIICGRALSNLGVPSIHVRGEIVEQQQGKPSTPTEASVREPDVSDLNELCANGFVRIIGHQHVLLERFQLSGRQLC
jgi:hypothetical protein